MDRDQLEAWLAEGLSLAQIAALTNRDPSTVGYWVKKYRLVANGQAKHARKGGLGRAQLEPLVSSGATLREMGEILGVSASTVRYWLGRHGLQTRRRRRLILGQKPKLIVDSCRIHGESEFILEGRGAYRCKRCRSAAVAKARRRMKRLLVQEAGGKCVLCGYDRHPGALHFHHVDPCQKRFGVSGNGSTRSFESLREEARKCVLLCGNCHAEVEAGVASLPGRQASSA